MSVELSALIKPLTPTTSQTNVHAVLAAVPLMYPHSLLQPPMTPAFRISFRISFRLA